MKAFATFLITLTLTLALVGSAASATTMLGENLLGNPGFEFDIVYEPPFDDNWLGFSGPGEPGVDTGVFNSINNPRTGDLSLELGIYDFSGTFAGAFQEVTGLSPGLPTMFSGWIAGLTEGGSVEPGLEIRIEWIDSASGQEIGRTDDLTPTLTDTYEMFSLPGIVPAGADTARLVFVIQSVLGPANLNVAFLDDASFTVIPVPAAVWLFGSALGLLAGVRRRIAA